MNAQQSYNNKKRNSTRNSSCYGNSETLPSKIFSLDELIVNFKDVCIYGRDLRLFEEDGEWLNDTCIQYQFKRLEKYLSKTITTKGGRCRKNDDVLMMDPAVVSFFMHQCDDDDEINDFAAGYNDFRFPIRRVFIPINDNMKPSSTWQSSGLGTHWSLLLMIIKNEKIRRKEFEVINSNSRSIPYSSFNRSYYIVPEDDNGKEVDEEDVDVVTLQFYHYDSVSGMNNIAARSVAWKWSLLLLMRLGSKESRERATKLAGGGVKEVSVNECPVPSQKNGYDCGVHVLITVEALLFHGQFEDIMQDDGYEINDEITRKDRKVSISLHDIEFTESDYQANIDDDEDEDRFYKNGINQILSRTLQNNPNYCRMVRNRIANDIRGLVETSGLQDTSYLGDSDDGNISDDLFSIDDTADIDEEEEEQIT